LTSQIEKSIIRLDEIGSPADISFGDSAQGLATSVGGPESFISFFF